MTASAELPGRSGHLAVEGDFAIKMPCGAPAPLALNGAHYVGCKLAKDHEGQHEVTVTWDR